MCELSEEISDNRERMVNVARRMRVEAKKSRVMSIMTWVGRATIILNKRLGGNDFKNGCESNI